MATLEEIRKQYPQYSDMSDGDLASALHKKFYSDMPRADFDKRLGLTPAKTEDVYTATARKEYDEAKRRGDPVGAGATRRFLQGATLNAADEILAGLKTPLEMVERKTFNPAEGYRYAKARENVELEDARKNGGFGGTLAEIGGGVFSGGGLARGGLTAMRAFGPGLAGRSGGAALDSAALGGVSGLMEGEGLGERASNAGVGVAVGGLVGGATPGTIAVGKALLSPITSNFAARANPENYARTQVARALTESGRTPQQIAQEVGGAAAEGQGVYSVADALGNPGQRMLSSVTRAPGAGRTAAIDFLESRQAGQGRRVANILSEGLDAPHTAAQTRTALTQARDTAADAAYGAARNNAGPVDLTRVLQNIDDTLQPGVNQIARPSGIANDSVEGVLEGFRNRMTDGRSVLSDFTAIQRLRGDISDAAQAARQAGQGNRARLLGGVLREMDAAMENASQGFRAANRQFEAGSRNIDAVDTGRQAAMRGRPEDTIPAFRGMPASEQAAFRAGYADPLIEQTQGAAYGVNKARPLTSDAFRDEAAAIAPMATGPRMQRQVGRENTMFETRNAALGGSKTADNLADAGAMGVDPSLIGNLLSGNWGGAARNAITASSNALSGNTPAVREEVGRLLTMRGGNVTPQQLQSILDEAVQRIQMREAIAAQLGRGAAGGLAIEQGRR